MPSKRERQILAVPSVLEVKKVTFSTQLKFVMLEKDYKKALRKSKKINVFRILYKSGSQKIVGFIVEPKKLNNNPCIIWNRGGSGEFSMIKLGTLFSDKDNMASLAAHGYIVLATQYPGVDGGDGLDQFGGENDIKAILNLKKIANKLPNCNAKRIGMGGRSRGGLMTYMCLAKVKWIKSAVIISSPVNQIDAGKERVGWREHQIKMFGSSIKAQTERSPLLWVNQIDKSAKILLLAGAHDDRVNPIATLQMSEKLHRRGSIYKTVIYEEGNHTLTTHQEERISELLKWFDRYI